MAWFAFWLFVAGAGASAFYLKQISGDSGSGATLGSFKAEAYGVGPTISYVRKIGKSNQVADASWLPQLHSVNTTKGDYFWSNSPWSSAGEKTASISYGEYFNKSILGCLSDSAKRLLWVWLLSGLCLAFSGCVNNPSQTGVQNKWRDPSFPAFEKGHTTESDVMRVLGPPSQVIALYDQTLFYYLREQLKTKARFLLLYNQTRESINYDRALFFFDKQGLLTDFALSEESIPRDK